MARGKQSPLSSSEEFPPGATRKAFERPVDPGGGAPGSGAGPRHAAGDEGSEIEDYGPADSAQPGVDPIEEDVPEGPPYAGHSGGAVGGTPAQRRTSGGQTHRGIAPGGVHRGDSTIGTDPKSGTD